MKKIHSSSECIEVIK